MHRVGSIALSLKPLISHIARRAASSGSLSLLAQGVAACNVDARQTQRVMADYESRCIKIESLSRYECLLFSLLHDASAVDRPWLSASIARSDTPFASFLAKIGYSYPHERSDADNTTYLGTNMPDLWDFKKVQTATGHPYWLTFSKPSTVLFGLDWYISHIVSQYESDPSVHNSYPQLFMPHLSPFVFRSATYRFVLAFSEPCILTSAFAGGVVSFVRPAFGTELCGYISPAHRDRKLAQCLNPFAVEVALKEGDKTCYAQVAEWDKNPAWVEKLAKTHPGSKITMVLEDRQLKVREIVFFGTRNKPIINVS